MSQTKLVVVAVMSILVVSGDLAAQTVQIRLTEAINIRKTTNKMGDVLVRESTLPPGTIIEVPSDQLQSAPEYVYWKDEKKQKPLSFIKGVKVISVPGISGEAVTELNKINEAAGLYMSRIHVGEGKILHSDEKKSTVALNKKTAIYSNQEAPPPEQNQTSKRKIKSEVSPDVVDKLDAVQGAARSVGSVGSPGACRQFVDGWIQAGVPKRALMNALNFYEKNQSKISNKRYLTIIDFTRRETEKRMYILDTQTGSYTTHRAAHGSGSDPYHRGVPTKFSGVPSSNATPPGFHLATNTYKGLHPGPTLVLEGLEPWNRTSKSRAVVIHGAVYATSKWIRENNNTLGRSHGCPAVDPAEISQIASKIRGGSLVYNYTPGV